MSRMFSAEASAAVRLSAGAGHENGMRERRLRFLCGCWIREQMKTEIQSREPEKKQILCWRTDGTNKPGANKRKPLPVIN